MRAHLGMCLHQFYFVSILYKGLLFEDRICSSGSKFLPFRINPFGKNSCYSEASMKKQKGGFLRQICGQHRGTTIPDYCILKEC